MPTPIPLQRPTPEGESGVAEFALWRLGFRPFYLLAGIFAALSVPLWVCQYAGLFLLPICEAWSGTDTRCCSAMRWR